VTYDSGPGPVPQYGRGGYTETVTEVVPGLVQPAQYGRGGYTETVTYESGPGSVPQYGRGGYTENVTYESGPGPVPQYGRGGYTETVTYDNGYPTGQYEPGTVVEEHVTYG